MDEMQTSTRRRFVRSEPVNQTFKSARFPIGSMSPILLGDVTRILRTIRNLKSNVYVVGGLVTEGRSLRDIDIVVNNSEDIAKIKKALGKYKSMAHFIVQKNEPPAVEFVKITGKTPSSPDLQKGKISKNEYAS